MIKFLDLHKINERFRPEFDAKINSILDSGWYLQGKENEEFSKHFASFNGDFLCLQCHPNSWDWMDLYRFIKIITV